VRTAVPLISYCLPVTRLKSSDEVHADAALVQVIVLSVAPLSVIPPPSAVTSVGVATEPSSRFLSSTVTVVELTVVVVPLTVKSPVIVTLELNPTAPVKVETPATETFPENVALEDAVRAATEVVPVSVGDAENTTVEEPVSSVNNVAKFADDGVAKNVAAPAARPETPDEIGNPVQFVRVPEEGVPNTGVVNVGDVRVLLVSVSVEEVVTTLTPSTAILPAEALEIVVSVACPNSRLPPTAKVFVLASKVKSASVPDDVIVPVVRLVTTTRCTPDAALKEDPVFESPEPSPLNDVAVIARPVALIPPEVMVTPVPMTALVAVITPALTICLLSSIIFDPEILMAIG